MNEYRYRFARAADIPAIIELMRPYNMHHIPSPEMGELDEKFFIVAEKDGELAGAAGFTFLSAKVGKTTLMAVRSDCQGLGIGMALQKRRMRILGGFGCERVVTNADRPETIAWYKRHFGFREIGRLPKIHSFGREDIGEWTTLEADLSDWESPPEPRGKLVINAALTGMVPRKRDNPHLPVTPGEIAADALRAAELGASIVHLHARGADEEPTPDSAVYGEIIARIRERRPDLIICVTTSGRNYSELEKRAMVLQLTGDLRPDMASLTLGSSNFAEQASVNAPQTIQALARKMLERGIKPELEIFEGGMIDYARYLFRKGFLRPPLYYNILLGSLGTMNASLRNLRFLVEGLPPCCLWTGTGIGSSQFAMEAEAIRLGGGVRTGLEDNLFLDKARTILARNEDFIARILGEAAKAGREPASPREVREWLEL